MCGQILVALTIPSSKFWDSILFMSIIQTEICESMCNASMFPPLRLIQMCLEESERCHIPEHLQETLELSNPSRFGKRMPSPLYNSSLFLRSLCPSLACSLIRQECDFPVQSCSDSLEESGSQCTVKSQISSQYRKNFIITSAFQP